MDRRLRVLVPGLFALFVVATHAAQIRPFYVSVTDSKGAPKAGLTAADLTVEVGGKPAPVVKVEPAAEPVSVVVITEGIDRSVISEIRKMMKAVIAGARAIHPDSRVGLMIRDGATAPTMRAVTADVAKLDEEIGRFFESSVNSPLLDSILTASQILALEKHTRRAIVAVTWGSQQPSDVLSPERVGLAVRASGASLWALELGGRETPNGAAEQRVLSDVTAASGGRRERTTVSSMEPLAERIMATLKAQYAVYLEDGVAPKAASPKVKAQSKDMKVLVPAWPAIR